MSKGFKKTSKNIVKSTVKMAKKSPEKAVVIGGVTTACAGYGAVKLLSNAIWRVRYAIRKSVQPPAPVPPDSDESITE